MAPSRTATFVSLCEQCCVRTRRYYSGDLTSAGPGVVADVGGGPRAAFSLGCFGEADVNIWLGTANATASLHVDAEHNVFLQLMGRKEFTLMPSAAWRVLGVHSRLHPCWRQARRRRRRRWGNA